MIMKDSSPTYTAILKEHSTVSSFMVIWNSRLNSMYSLWTVLLFLAVYPFTGSRFESLIVYRSSSISVILSGSSNANEIMIKATKIMILMMNKIIPKLWQHNSTKIINAKVMSPSMHQKTSRDGDFLDFFLCSRVTM